MARGDLGTVLPAGTIVEDRAGHRYLNLRQGKKNWIDYDAFESMPWTLGDTRDDWISLFRVAWSSIRSRSGGDPRVVELGKAKHPAWMLALVSKGDA